MTGDFGRVGFELRRGILLDLHLNGRLGGTEGATQAGQESGETNS